MIHVRLTDPQRQELRQATRQAVGRVALRAQMVLLSDRGYSVPEIAEIQQCGCDVVRLWLQRYQQEGLPGLEDDPRGGRPRKHPLAPGIVDTQAGQSPRCSGHVQSCWTVGLLRAFLAARFRLALSCSTVRRYLRAEGWRWARPRLHPASVLPERTDPEAESKLAAIESGLQAARAGLAHLLHLDECDLHLLPVVRAMWMKGPRVRVPTPGINARRAFFGARDALTGAWYWQDRERKLAVHFVAFLQELAAAYPRGRLILVMDNVPTHKAKVVQAWLALHPRVEVLWLPKYAAHEVNPVERVWGLMKSKVAANRLCSSIQELVAIATRFFEEQRAEPVALPMAA